MAWEWSHSEAAYDFAREKLGKLSLAELREIAEEWKTLLNDKAEAAHEHEYEFAEADEFVPPYVAPCTIHTPEMYECSLAEFIWEHASGYEHGRLCSNGGHELYLCPYGCHAVDLGDMPEDWAPEDY